MNNNELLKHNEKKKINIRIIIFISIIVLFFLSLIIFLAYYFLIYTNDSNTLKRYLTKEGYSCNKVVCTKIISNTNYSINYLDGELTASNQNFILKLKPNNNPLLEVKENDYICLYEKENYNYKDLINEEFSYNTYCKQYIDEVNEIISTNISIYEKTGINYYN